MMSGCAAGGNIADTAKARVSASSARATLAASGSRVTNELERGRDRGKKISSLVGTFRELIFPERNTLRRAGMRDGGDARGDASAALDAERRLWNPALDDASVPLIGEFKYPLEKPLGPVMCTSRRVSTGIPGVTKQIMRAAPGTDDPADPPGDDATCFVHYDAWQRNETDAEVWSTRQESEPHQVILGADHARDPKRRHLVGVAACLRTMRPGERALFTVPPELAYGSEGNFSFPAVPPDCALTLDLELIGVKRADEEPMARADMLYEERIDRVRKHRHAGNAAFRAGDPAAAAREYEMSLSFLTDDMMMQLFGDYLEEANGEKLPAHLNLCACLLRLGRHAEAVDQANRALGVDPTCAKALYRRGRARQAMGQDEDARNDLVRAMECSPGGEDAAVLRALRELESEEVAKARARKGVFGGLFGDAKREDIEEEAKATARMDDVNEAGVRGDEAETPPGFLARVGRAFGFGGRRT